MRRCGEKRAITSFLTVPPAGPHSLFVVLALTATAAAPHVGLT